MDDNVDAAASTTRLAQVFDLQQQACSLHPYPSMGTRRAQLQALRRQLQRYQDVLAQAMHTDFGFRSESESKMLDLLGSVLQINHALGSLKRWMRPSRRSTELVFLTNRLEVHYQPKGVVGIVVPWNFPVYLAVGPLTTALAAGNRVMLKMSEASPATTRVLRRMLAEVFPEEQVAVFGEELTDPGSFTRLKFDHLVFTGSPAVGRMVMRAAADNLTPVTLELGGKSPALVTRNYPVRDAALRICHGKIANSGQICVSPDYALVPREQVDAFVDGVRAAFGAFYPASQSPSGHDFASIISERHHARLQALLDDAQARGATVIACTAPQAGRKMPLQIVVGCTPEMAIMQEEIFGPVLPVLAYDRLEEAIDFVSQRERPLAMYLFSRDADEQRAVLQRTRSGGVTINDWGWHVINHDAPFGGTGQSGIGTYHGQEGFRELSHARTVFKRHRFFPIGLFYPPYGNLAQRLTLRHFLGRADPEL